jgi:uncharacterized protein (DUF362 family)
MDSGTEENGPTLSQSHKLANKNITRLARLLKPDLSIIDGFGAMEGDGPVDGETVNLQAVTS